ncbi:MAG: acyl-ACP--UDP-N-acetylglucosamine O-acyltransferase [Myxococcota bacterium]|nr:acyl-ACP--UDP-N-acetylglucosamine O-acyltransferase [Myxococcota bacterium]
MRIDKSARIDPTANIASDVHIGPFAIVGPRVSIDAHTHIGAYTIIEQNTVIGSHNRISPHVVLGADPQDKKYAGEESFLRIGHHNTIREFSTVHRGTQGGTTTIGDHNLLMAYCHIAHDAEVGSNCTFANGATIGGHVVVASNATLGGLCAVHQFCRIGIHAMLAGGSMLVQDLPPYLMAQGDRARLCGINRVGLRRADFTRERIDDLHRAYKRLFLGSFSRAREEMRTAPCSREVDIMLSFIDTSKRGVCKARR